METKQKPETKKPVGRQTGFKPKPHLKIEVQGDNVVITIPKKDLTKKLLAEFI